MIHISDLETIIHLVEKHNIAHFEFSQGDSKVVLKKADAVAEVSVGNNDVPQTASKAQPQTAETLTQDAAEEFAYIKSSMAGTVYLKKEEDAAPLVKLQDVVEADTVIAIVEVMKLFYDVQAGLAGEIVDVLVQDKEFVEYGQPLFKVRLKG